MATKPAARPTSKTSDVATFEDFRGGVSYLLVHEHGMPEIVARDVLEAEADYLEKSFQEAGDRRVMVTEVAEELACEPRRNVEWIRKAKGDMILSLNDKVRELLESIATTGLYGGTPEDVAQVLLCRGVETVLPVAQGLSAIARRS